MQGWSFANISRNMLALSFTCSMGAVRGPGNFMQGRRHTVGETNGSTAQKGRVHRCHHSMQSARGGQQSWHIVINIGIWTIDQPYSLPVPSLGLLPVVNSVHAISLTSLSFARCFIIYRPIFPCVRFLLLCFLFLLTAVDFVTVTCPAPIKGECKAHEGRETRSPAEILPA